MAAARYLYSGPPDASTMAALGLTPEDFAGEAVDVWADHWDAVMLFSTLNSGAWAVSQVGVYGLRPEALDVWRRAAGIPDDRWAGMLPDLAVLERGAVAEMRRGTA